MTELIARVVVPLVSTFALFVGMALFALRHPPEARDDSLPDPGWSAFLRSLVVTALGGYACFLMIVLVFNVVVAGQHGALSSAIGGGAFLAFGVALPVFVALGSIAWITGRPPRAGRGDRSR